MDTVRNEHPTAIVKVDTSNFAEEVMKPAEPVIAIFSFEGCGHCAIIAPFLEEIATALAGKVKIVKVNDTENPELATQYGVLGFPTLAMFKGGEVADIFLGAKPPNIETKLRSWISKTVQTTKMNTTIPNEHPTAIVKGDISNFPEEVLKSAEPVIVHFWEEWCPPFELIEPILEQVATELAGKVKVVKLNIGENRDFATQYGVHGFPMLAMFKGGEVADIYVGGSLGSWISHATA
ncbi:thiol reductase thioredoxin [Sinorhizobium meliloti]|nr:thioredoxin domain-containing protein [Sinorhizobium meliloti]PST28767.1 thioredoxin [Mesorhizobium loti]ARS69717.1 thioredoxin [Sinorhizobium meliloti RU11/001]MBP2464594.1 thioredoxin 1 [Sinorhizobium meliloti]MDE3767383.1 thiol reductase thioredoxin [Sinorhizobium meliloti]MDE3779989.1 thiol reductase thioredoxin [Sinorhizobium meliloti]